MSAPLPKTPLEKVADAVCVAAEYTLAVVIIAALVSLVGFTIAAVSQVLSK